MGKNNIKVIVIVLGIIAITAISTGVYFYYNNREDNSNTGENNKPQPTVTPTPSTTPTPQPGRDELSQNDPTIKALIKRFNIPLGKEVIIAEEVSDPTLLNSDNDYRLFLASLNINEDLIKETTCENYEIGTSSNGKIPCGEENPSEAYHENNVEELKKESTLVISENILKEKYIELFGTNYQYKAESFYNFDGIHNYIYNKSTNEYVMYTSGSGTSGFPIKNIFKSAYKEDDRLFMITEYQKDTYAPEIIILTYEFKLENGNYTFVKVTENK